MKPYRPSNGTEGDMFLEQWCARCTFQHPEYIGCQIIADSITYEVEDAKYPQELVKDDTGIFGKCTKFQEAEP